MRFANVREALDYITIGDGAEWSEEKMDKVYHFLKKLPHNPKEIDFGYGFITMTVKDYNAGWFAVVKYGKHEGRLSVKIVDGDMMDAREGRVKTNKEALELLEKYEAVECPSDTDKYWHMSDDHKYWSKMNDLFMKYLSERKSIESQLA